MLTGEPEAMSRLESYTIKLERGREAVKGGNLGGCLNLNLERGFLDGEQ